MLGKDYPGQDCTLARALEVVGERWTMLILRDAFYGVQRFGHFADHLDVPRAVLSDRLRALVDAGVLQRHPGPLRSGRDLYVLTEDGQALWPALHAMLRWGDRLTEGRSSRRFVHRACDTRLDPLGACPSCHVTPEPGEIDAVAMRRSARTDAVTAALHPRTRLLEPLAVGRAVTDGGRAASTG